MLQVLPRPRKASRQSRPMLVLVPPLAPAFAGAGSGAWSPGSGCRSPSHWCATGSQRAARCQRVIARGGIVGGRGRFDLAIVSICVSRDNGAWRETVGLRSWRGLRLSNVNLTIVVPALQAGGQSQRRTCPRPGPSSFGDGGEGESRVACVRPRLHHTKTDAAK